jgi:gliding motility-associated-like protein
MQIRLSYLFLFFFLSTYSLYGQFTVTGDTEETSCNCFQVTDDVASEDGSFYHTSTINLTTAFNLKFMVNFGCESTGGEGLAFVLQNGPWTTGAGGFGIGYQDIAGNVLTVEFDTRDNEASGEIDNWDVASDHISLQDNGDIDHEPSNPNHLLGIPSGLNAGETATPHPIKPGFPEIEDCEDHLVEINWTPGANQTIQVVVDGIVSMTYIGDMIADQFGGSPIVNWGWTGSTGVFSNVQTVCMALVPDFTYSTTVCPGEEITFTDASTSNYDVTDWAWDFDGLGTSIIENPLFTFDEAGTYEVELTITDDEGCESSATIEIPVGFDTETSVDDDAVCPDASTVLHALGSPFTESECCFKLVLNDLWGDYWGSGVANTVEIFADGVSTGTYTPTSFDPGSGTSDTIDLCFDQGTELEFVINGADSPAECAYYFLTEDLDELISVNGATPGTWVDGASEEYTVDCGLEEVDYEYLWDNAALLDDETSPDPTATVPTTTWFHVDITDTGTGCTITDSILVTTNPPVEAIISGLDSICDGDTGELTIEFTGPGPYDVTVFGPAGPIPAITGIASSPYTLNVSLDGDYTIIAVSGDGCVGTFSGSGTIEVIELPEVSIGTSATYCDGDPISDLFVLTSEGGEINWYDNPTLTPPAIATGLSYTPPAVVGSNTYYAAETETLLGCEGPADAVTITINPIPPAPSYTGETTFCEGDLETELFAEPSLAGEIRWYDSPPPTGILLATGVSYSPTLAIPGATFYITENADGCEGPATEVVITVNPSPDAPLVTGETEYCLGDEASPLNAVIGAGGTIEWRNEAGILLGAGTSFSPTLALGSFDIYVYELLGDCESEATIVTITVNELPTISLPEDAIICLGDSINITATNNGYPISWSDGQTGESVWLKPEVSGSFTATTTSPICGSSTDEIFIIVKNFAEIETSNDTIIGVGGEATLVTSSEGEVTYSWSPDVFDCLDPACSSVIVIPNRPTLYIVTATDENGCQTQDTVFVDIKGVMEVFVPNLFSPNNDGQNDYLVVYGPRLFNFSLEVYDRWGKLIYETNDQKEYWDGTFYGEYLAPQTFVYIMKGETILGEELFKEGNVTIVE